MDKFTYLPSSHCEDKTDKLRVIGFTDITLLLTQNTELVPLTHSENALNVSRPHHTQAKLEKVTITSHFGFVFEENSGREIA